MRGALPHALLITGSFDEIEHELRQDFKKLLCENGSAASSGQDECPSCHLSDSEAGHPDLVMVHPEGKMATIKIDAVREVMSFLNQSALKGGMRIVVFTAVDTMTIAAQNALLKSLEEPGKNTLIILLTDKPHLLLPTIKSRCQLLELRATSKIQNAALAKILLQSFEPLDFAENHKELDALTCIHTQMALIHDLLSLHFGSKPLIFADLAQHLIPLTHVIPRQALLKNYQRLLELSELLQKNPPINQELCLFQLALAWRTLISHNKHI